MYKLLTIFLILVPISAFANVVWPGLFLSSRMLWWCVPAGILIEYFILKEILKKRWDYILLATVISNLISTIFGAIGALIGNLAFEFTIGQLLFKFYGIGTFNPFSWSSAIFLGALTSTIIEIYSLKIIFKISLTSKQKYIYFGANLISTLLAFASILVKKPFY